MAGYTSPNLTVSLSSTGFAAEMNANFTAIQQALDDIESILGAIDLSGLAPFSSVFMRDVPMTLNLTGAVGASQGSEQELGFIAPFDCEVIKLFARAVAAPTSGTVGIDVKADTGESDGTVSLLESIITIDQTEADTVKTAYARTDPQEVDEGTFIEVHITEEAGSLEGLEDLQLVLTVTARDWDVYGAT